MFRIAKEMELYRRPHPVNGAIGNHKCGCFSVTSRALHIIAASGEDWDHVSVSAQNRTPTWEEMEWVRRKFWQDNATVMQIHPPLKDYVNNHPYTLHLWRPWNAEIPLPPKGFI